MAELTMPKMGDAMEEGTVLRWLKKEGDAIEEEEPIAEIQTEKATIEVPSYTAGKLVKILVSEGQTVPVGTPIAQYEPVGGDGAAGNGGAPAAAIADREQVPGGSRPVPATPGPPDAGGSRQPSGGREPAHAAPPDLAESRPNASAPPAREAGERVKATPLAKKVAAARGIDLSQVRGTGPGGRIVEADVEGAAQQTPSAPPAGRPAAPSPAPPAPSPGQLRPLSPMRKAIAQRLSLSKQTVPHFYVSMEINMEAAAQFREQLNALDPERPKLSFDVMIAKACATALQKLPAVYSQYTDEGIVQPDGIHIGLAVALDEGLIVPVIQDVDRKSLSAIAADAAALIQKARAGKLQPNEYSGGTFTISNLGMYGVTDFVAVINPPESAILAVAGIHEVPVVRDGQLAVGKRMMVTLSADHRAVDGAICAQFLREVKRLLEAPLLLV